MDSDWFYYLSGMNTGMLFMLVMQEVGNFLRSRKAKKDLDK